MKLSKVLFLVVISIIASSMSVGCAVLEKRYTPPHGEQGKNCVRQCGKQQQTCKSRCDKNYQACTGQAQQKFDQNKKAYDADSQRLATDARAKEECSSHKNFFKKLVCESSATSPKPQLDTSGCDKDCGCINDYDFCWTQCGGTVKQECVANCK
ncbi:MAG: hypothetical protein BWK79_09455 [Beggiatoa sp. IS2]|nr:MAG: hypothetical protein BWK79_09455 [Beggiatoa sp. IS2]